MALVSDWTQVGNEAYYRKAELYTLEWGGGLNVSDLIVSAAPYGGPVALTWSHDNYHQHRTGQAPSSPVIIIFSAAGVKLAAIKGGSDSLIQMGWSQSEQLLCVLQDGSVAVYDMFGEPRPSFNMGQEAKESGVISALVFDGLQGTGVAVLTSSHRVYVISNTSDPKPRKYSDIPGGSVLCWGVVRVERSICVLLSQPRGLCWINAVDSRADVVESPLLSEGIEDTSKSNTPPMATVICIAVCTNNRSIALLYNTGKLWVGAADLSTCFCIHDTKSSVKPHQMAWCGTGSVVVVWEVTLQLITITGSVTTFYLDSPVHLVQEIDCVRLIGNTKHHILYKIPHVTTETLGIGSMSSGALLLEAYLGYQEQSPRAYDCLTMITGRMEEAVQQCIQTAALDLCTHNQKLLLKSATFGRTFLPGVEPEAVKEVALKLRLLNDARTKKIGMPLTYPQLERLTLAVFLERLVARRLFPVALAIAKGGGATMQAQVPRILAHWACYKVSSTRAKSDDQLAQEIHSKLGYTPGISYTDIANRANSLGRKQLAVKLLGYECRAKEQVTALLRLDETCSALARAQTTGDSDLILTVLQHIKQSGPLADFLMVVRGSAVCRAVYARGCLSDVPLAGGAASGGGSSREQLRDLHVQEDGYTEQARMRLEEAYAASRTDGRLGLLTAAAECFRRAKDDFSTQLTEDQLRLLKCQVSLEEVHQKSFVDLSLYDTMAQLLRAGHTKEADKLRADFKVTDKRYWWMRVGAHARANHWTELESFARIKKNPPIGFEPFVDECLKQNNVDEARKYVHRVKDENKVEYLRKCGLVAEADKLAEAAAAAAVSPLARVITAAPQLQALRDQFSS